MASDVTFSAHPRPSDTDRSLSVVRTQSQHPVRSHRLRGATRVRLLIAACDLVAVAVGVAVAGARGVAGLGFAVALLVMIRLAGGYRTRLRLRPLEHAPSVLSHMGVLAVAGFAFGGASGVTWFGWQAVVTAGAFVAGRCVASAVVHQLRARGRMTDNAVIVGSGVVASAITEALDSDTAYGLRLVGSLEEPGAGGASHLGATGDLAAVAQRHNVSSVIVAFSQTREHALVDLVRTAVLHGLDVYVVPRFFDIGTPLSRDEADDVWGIPLYPVTSRPGIAARGLKRSFDLLVALTAVAVFSPLLVLIAIAVRLSSEGPILFRQPRIGQHGREFEMLKFRTLYTDQCSNTAWDTASPNSRTPVGSWLRRLNLDELPQLWNVVRGDMSIIGPRPERTRWVNEFSVTVPGYSARHRLPVGLTGWAQVNGLRGDTRIAERVRFDNRYIETWSPWRDLLIFFRTFATVCRQATSKARVPAVQDVEVLVHTGGSEPRAGGGDSNSRVGSM